MTKRNKANVRYRSGQRVRQGGLYVNDWGGEQVLLPDDTFPSHPQMGHTAWTYAGRPELINAARRGPKSLPSALAGFSSSNVHPAAESGIAKG